MKNFTLNIGELAVSKKSDVSYHCIGLGSCVGLFLQDRATGISGGAHILLPECTIQSVSTNRFYSVGRALQELLHQFQYLGSNLNTLRAKITGGANVISTGYEVGAQNVSVLVQHLVQEKIFIAAQDVGGSQSRSALFDAQTGLMTVRMSLTKECKIY